MTPARDWHASACILCSRNCGIEVQAEGGGLERIRGDRRHPISEGYLCQKAQRLSHYQDHRERLTSPLRRRPDGTFEPISWAAAIAEVAARLAGLRERHGGRAIAFYGGGGQGNHLGTPYMTSLRNALGSPYHYSALAQEKTGDFWVNGRLFGRQTAHITEDVEHADFVLFVGTNPWQSHGIRNARQVLRAIARDPDRRMAVVDPRRSETAAMADHHLALRPGTDAQLLAALLATIAREGLFDSGFLERRTAGAERVLDALRALDPEALAHRAGVPAGELRAVARAFAAARRGCVRVDLGLQQSPNSTLSSYLEKLLFLLTGNFGQPGGNNLHTQFMPVIGHTDDDDRSLDTAVTGTRAIARLHPPNVLPDEVLTDDPGRLRALWVDSTNPAATGADSQAYAEALERLELVVVVDVAMTETAELADYVLPAPSQYEKWEASFFNMEFPANFFQLRAPLAAPLGDTLPEPEIYHRLLVALGRLEPREAALERAALEERAGPPGRSVFAGALAEALARRPELAPVLPALLYGTLGRALPGGAAAAAALWGASTFYASRHEAAVRRAGIEGEPLGDALFEAILRERSGLVISVHDWDEMWSFVRHPDRRVRLDIPELLSQLDGLVAQPEPASDAYPLVLAAGERRSYNANQIYRDPAWRKDDPDGALRIHPADALALGLADGAAALCQSRRGEVEVTILHDEAMREGTVSLPHGYGQRYAGDDGVRRAHGPAINLLTDRRDCDPIAKTPFHKHVRVRLRPLPIGADAAEPHDERPASGAEGKMRLSLMRPPPAA